MSPEIIDLRVLRESAAEACGLLKVLANPDRLLLLCQMTQGEHSVSDLAAATGVEQPSLSQQLTVLRVNGLVSTRREGKQVFYNISSQNAMQVMDLLYRLYCLNDQNEER
ncbi:ArsR/SmtB family transcription factor [Halopseudomonas sp.]|uniref:ArsR/SmtB family transcription factor n=1 Tax=Halopseudomonas sp. TaxID=2901191 RepID=UPI000C6594CB|nr:transcriptional regulator [Pseudomonadaceae bacterium]MBL4879647.1 winged helix-turn-helix transcriptional regulator [Hyphomonas sp.]|tara:strand:+ start:2862 stop:3191 length:330 start_codon:yes stop_codon:yes gene_type:complete